MAVRAGASHKGRPRSSGMRALSPYRCIQQRVRAEREGRRDRESEIGAVRDAERASERASVCVEEDFLLKIGSPMALALGIAEKKGYRRTGESSNV